MGEGDSNFARNQRMTAAEMMARKTRLCQEIWQRQVHTQPSLHRLLACFAVVLCCCALLACFAVVLCTPHALLSCFACPSADVHSFALSLWHVLHWFWLVGGLVGSPVLGPHKMPCHSCGGNTFFLLFSYVDQSVLNEIVAEQ